MPTNRPKLPSVVDKNGVAKTQERHQMPRLNLDTSQFTKPGGTLDHEALGRLLTRMQDAYTEGTQAARSHPLAKMCVLENVQLVAGKTYTLKHTLGEAFVRYSCLRSYAPAGKGVTSIGITAGGQGLPASVTVSIGPPDMPNGVQATATVTVTSGAVTAVNITNQGSGYSAVPPAAVKSTSGGGVVLAASLGPVYAGTFSVSEVDPATWPAGITADKYLVLYSNCTGTYDIGVYGS